MGHPSFDAFRCRQPGQFAATRATLGIQSFGDLPVGSLFGQAQFAQPRCLGRLGTLRATSGVHVSLLVPVPDFLRSSARRVIRYVAHSASPRLSFERWGALAMIVTKHDTVHPDNFAPPDGENMTSASSLSSLKRTGTRSSHQPDNEHRDANKQGHPSQHRDVRWRSKVIDAANQPGFPLAAVEPHRIASSPPRFAFPGKKVSYAQVFLGITLRPAAELTIEISHDPARRAHRPSIVALV
jgi:hypothetical protein